LGCISGHKGQCISGHKGQCLVTLTPFLFWLNNPLFIKPYS
jgi:hypothetical protein